MGGPDLAGPSGVLSIDLDDALIPFAQFSGAAIPRTYRSGIRRDVARTLEVLRRAGAKATFFVNAQLAAGEDGMLADVAAEGHALASHGYRHDDLRKLSLGAFRDDLRRSLDVLRPVQDRVRGYRPPAFTMPYREDYFAVLRECGIEYVSAGAATRWSNVPPDRTPVPIHQGITHVPITIWRAGWLAYPSGYGFVARLLPQPLYLKSLELRRRDEFFHFYCHTFEVAGVPGAREPGGFRERAGWAHRLYLLRCRDRAELFGRIFSRRRFEPIETYLDRMAPQ